MGDTGKRRTTRSCLGCGEQTTNPSYCSLAHQRRHEFDVNVSKWISGKFSGTTKAGHSAYYIKRYLIETLGEKCQRCGWAEVHPLTGKVPIQLEHIDGEPDNNRPENVTLLCPNCHSLTETYGALNGPRSRRSRGLPVREGRVRAYRAKYSQ